MLSMRHAKNTLCNCWISGLGSVCINAHLWNQIIMTQSCKIYTHSISRGHLILRIQTLSRKVENSCLWSSETWICNSFSSFPSSFSSWRFCTAPFWGRRRRRGRRRKKSGIQYDYYIYTMCIKTDATIIEYMKSSTHTWAYFNASVSKVCRTWEA